MPDRPIIIISGTNRPGSNTFRVAQAVYDLYQIHGLSAELFNLADVPFEVFNPAVYGSKLSELADIQRRIIASAGLHVVTPEYNGSFPGILKYFVDLLDFSACFNRKPIAFVGLASGRFAAVRAVEQLQMVFAYGNAHLYPDRVFIGGVHNQLHEAGGMKDAALHERMSKQVTGFAHFAGVFGG